MKKILLFVIISFIITASLYSTAAKINASEKHRFIVKIPSPTEDANYIWNLILNIQFYVENKYSLALPKDEIINELIEKKKTGQLTKTDWDTFKSHFTKDIYDEKDYLIGYKKVDSVLINANKAIQTFEKYKREWGFFIPNEYCIVLTLYGPGGSYNPSNGEITLMTTKTGQFKRGTNPLETIIHEAVHIGIEKPIIKKFGLSHWTKERIVDKFVSYHFGSIFPNYLFQPNPETSIDSILNDPTIWNDLPNTLELFISKNNNH